MSTPFLNCFILICKIMICISMFVAILTHHWIREYDGRKYRGLGFSCYDYGHFCHGKGLSSIMSWFFYITTLLNILLESLNIFLLYKRRRSRMNLVLEELSLITTLVLLIPSIILILIMFVLIKTDAGEAFDWSFYSFLLSITLAVIEFICSLVRVVNYCRENSFRSNVITYTTTNNHQTIQIQT